MRRVAESEYSKPNEGKKISRDQTKPNPTKSSPFSFPFTSLIIFYSLNLLANKGKERDTFFLSLLALSFALFPSQGTSLLSKPRHILRPVLSSSFSPRSFEIWVTFLCCCVYANV